MEAINNHEHITNAATQTTTVTNHTDWQNEGSTVYKLKESGSFRRANGQLGPEQTNDYSFRVYLNNPHINTGAAENMTPAGIVMKETLLAEHIVKLLKEHPFLG